MKRIKLYTNDFYLYESDSDGSMRCIFCVVVVMYLRLVLSGSGGVLCLSLWFTIMLDLRTS